MEQLDYRYKPNFEYRKTDDGFEVLIPQTKSSSWFYAPHFQLLFLVIFSILVFERTTEKGVGFSLLLDVILFSYMYIIIAMLLLWLYFGREVVRVDSDKITLQKKLKWRFKTKVFLLSEIRGLKLDVLDHKYYFWRNHSYAVFFGERALGFTYKITPVRFGRGLSEQDANALLVLLKAELDRANK